MNWKLLFYEANRGEKPVQEFIKKLSPATFAKILRMLELLEQYGTFLCMPHCKKITKDIYELRIRGKEEIRIFYFIKKRNIYLPYAFKKKSQNTPVKEIEVAERRIDLLTNI